MLLRLIPGHGGDGTVDGIIAMNDAGLDMLTLFTTDSTRLGNTQGYTSWHAPRGVMEHLYIGIAPGNRLLAASAKGGRKKETPLGTTVV